MFKSHSYPPPSGPKRRELPLIEVGLAIVLAAAWIAFVATMLQNRGASSAREPGPLQSTQSITDDSVSGPAAGEPSSQPAAADEYGGADVEDQPAEPPVSGWMG